MLQNTMHRQVLILASSQSLFQTVSVMVMTIGGLAGANIANTPTLATLPIASMFLGTALMMFPASMLMARVGRRNGFLFGAFLGVLGGIIASIGIFIVHSCFWLWVRYVSGPISPLLSFTVLLPVKWQLTRFAHVLFLG